MSTDPRETLFSAPMSALQIVAVAMTVGLTALDGFDVLSISFAAPGIAAEWGIDRAALGVVLSMELFGMALGALVLGRMADRIGRRPTMLICLVLMSVGMFMVTGVKQIPGLQVWRFTTGLGIGGLLATANAVAAEFSNLRRRSLSVALMANGYPIGAVVGGSVVKILLQDHGWRSVFYFGGTVTALFIPLLLFVMPESVHWLALKQPANALQRINKALARMGHATLATLPPPVTQLRQRALADLFSPALRLTTILCALACFLHMMTFYFILKWIPKIVVDMHFPAAAAAGVLVWANVGGATGGALLGVLSQKIGLKPLTIGVMLLSTVMVVLFGRASPDLNELSALCAVAGFCTNAGIVGLYAIYAQVFPTQVRATGTGVSIGLGRGGAALGPIAAGFLFTAGYSLPAVATAIALGSLLAAAVLALLSCRPPASEKAHEWPTRSQLPLNS
ncbi:MAG: MFS transporter [Proteobacteria bacterium]|nr:MFS transporter [Pseudomonadota bacterium]